MHFNAVVMASLAGAVFAVPAAQEAGALVQRGYGGEVAAYEAIPADCTEEVEEYTPEHTSYPAKGGYAASPSKDSHGAPGYSAPGYHASQEGHGASGYGGVGHATHTITSYYTPPGSYPTASPGPGEYPGNDSDPTTPDDGSEPEYPGDGENPDDGTDPTDPDDGTDPTDPDDGTDPTDPDDGTDPTDPDDGTDPTDPDDGTDPTDPDDGTDPTDPEEPLPTCPTGNAVSCCTDDFIFGSIFGESCTLTTPDDVLDPGASCDSGIAYCCATLDDGSIEGDISCFEV